MQHTPCQTSGQEALYATFFLSSIAPGGQNTRILKKHAVYHGHLKHKQRDSLGSLVFYKQALDKGCPCPFQRAGVPAQRRCIWAASLGLALRDARPQRLPRGAKPPEQVCDPQCVHCLRLFRLLGLLLSPGGWLEAVLRLLLLRQPPELLCQRLQLTAQISSRPQLAHPSTHGGQMQQGQTQTVFIRTGVAVNTVDCKPSFRETVCQTKKRWSKPGAEIHGLLSEPCVLQLRSQPREVPARSSVSFAKP